MKYKVLITASGLGQRLGELTKYTNKALIRIGSNPALSYIIESYPKVVEIVITLGYYADHVRDFVKLCYPDRKVKFVLIDKFQGSGSSLGYSMLQAKQYLNCPFIYHACDTIVSEEIPEPQYNWNGGYKGTNSSMYASFNVDKESVQIINDKGGLNYDFLHIGLVGIYDFQAFWNALEEHYRTNNTDLTLNDCKVINLMISKNSKFRVKEFKNWFDIGNVESLTYARKTLTDKFINLDKPNESIFIFSDFVIKFYHDKKIVENKVKRAKLLNNLVPDILESNNNFYKYKFIKGELYSKIVTPSDFEKFLLWSDKNLWIKRDKTTKEVFKKQCFDFYYNKTILRVKEFLGKNYLIDGIDLINDEEVPSVKSLLNKINFDLLTTANQFQIHGDLILDNVIKTDLGYKLVDWRQDFGGNLEVGDIYYDLAKLNHNLTLNHEMINNNYFKISRDSGKIYCDVYRSENLVQCQSKLFEYISKEKLDGEKVNLLTSLIWLNMSSLHNYPFNLFLFYFGKLTLWRKIKKLNNYLTI